MSNNSEQIDVKIEPTMDITMKDLQPIVNNDDSQLKKTKKKIKRKYGLITKKEDLVNGILEGCHRNIGTSLIPPARIKKGFRTINSSVKISKKIYEPFRLKLIDIIYEGVYSIIQHLKDISKKMFRLDAAQVLF